MNLKKTTQRITDSKDTYLSKDELMELKAGTKIIGVFNTEGETFEEKHKVISVSNDWLETEGPNDEEDEYSYTSFTFQKGGVTEFDIENLDGTVKYKLA